MERNEITTAEKLAIGDRFYKQGDKKKKVLVMVKHEVKQTSFRTYKYFYCPADVFDLKLANDRLKERQYASIMKDTSVIFLRSAS